MREGCLGNITASIDFRRGRWRIQLACGEAHYGVGEISQSAANVNFSFSCSRLPNMAAPGTEWTKPDNTSGSIRAGIQRTRKAP